jgi:hypothetical protein
MVTRLRFLPVLLLSVAGAGCLAGAAQAQAGKGESEKLDRAQLQALLPTSNLGSSADLANNYVRQRITPLGNPKLYFEIPVAKGWDSRPIEASREELAADDKSLVPLALITPDNGDGSVALEVRYMRVPEKATLERFLEAYPEQAGFTVLGRQNGEFNGRVVKEELLRMETKDFGPVLTRLAAMRKGDRFLIVAGSAPEKEYEKVKNIFAVAIIGFDPDAAAPEH